MPEKKQATRKQIELALFSVLKNIQTLNIDLYQQMHCMPMSYPSGESASVKDRCAAEEYLMYELLEKVTGESYSDYWSKRKSTDEDF